jgi:hypothetical protein
MYRLKLLLLVQQNLSSGIIAVVEAELRGRRRNQRPISPQR